MRSVAQLVREMSDDELAHLARVILVSHFEIHAAHRYDKWPAAPPSRLSYDFGLPTDDATHYADTLARHVARRLGFMRRRGAAPQ